MINMSSQDCVFEGEMRRKMEGGKEKKEEREEKRRKEKETEKEYP